MKKIPMVGMALAVLIATQSQAQLSETQTSELNEVALGFSQQATVFEGLMQNKLTQLALELQREGRLDDKASAKKASANVDVIMTDLGKLYGQFVKTKVQYVLKAKNVLTDEQKMYLLSQLTPSDSLPYEELDFLQPELFDLPLNLSVKQEKKLIELEASLMIKEIELERDVELVLLDLRPLLMGGSPNPEAVDPLVLKLADLAGKSIDNRVKFFLKAKNVLTLDQKRLMAHMMGLD